MIQKKKYSRLLFIVFPALAVLLGWGLRGHIGGGPFGAMIPGAMLAFSICLLLELPAASTSIIIVFGVVGIGLGGEMTYGQTLGFLRNPETVMWGILATTIKGGVWGVLGGTVLSMGFIYNRLTKKTIVISFLFMMAGMILGFKLINEPMVLYFSDIEKPRSESWAALLMGAIALLLYLKYKTPKPDFKIVSQFAIWGLIGGCFGFGLGGLWFVMGESLPKDIVFHSWWKMMEFTFGAFLGAALGYAAWLSCREVKSRSDTVEKPADYLYKSSYKEIGVALFYGILIFLLIPQGLEPFVDAASSADGLFMTILRTLARIMVNYAFFGLLLILAVMYFPKSAWQIAITLTFCHTVIDFADDHITNVIYIIPLILIPTIIVAILTAYYQGEKNVISSLFLLLIWSTVLVSTIKIGFNPQKIDLAGLSINKIIFGIFIVDIIFLISAIILSWIIVKEFRRE